MTKPKINAVRGRPVTGNATSSTERGKIADAALLESGGAIIRLRLSPEAATALGVLLERGGSQRDAIELALIDAARRPLFIVDTNDK
jgi:hypothetical protein